LHRRVKSLEAVGSSVSKAKIVVRKLGRPLKATVRIGVTLSPNVNIRKARQSLGNFGIQHKVQASREEKTNIDYAQA